VLSARSIFAEPACHRSEGWRGPAGVAGTPGLSDAPCSSVLRIEAGKPVRGSGSLPKSPDARHAFLAAGPGCQTLQSWSAI
jgi:hypothetical protein